MGPKDLCSPGAWTELCTHEGQEKTWPCPQGPDKEDVWEQVASFSRIQRAASRSGSSEHFLEKWPWVTCGQEVPTPAGAEAHP